MKRTFKIMKIIKLNNNFEGVTLYYRQANQVLPNEIILSKTLDEKNYFVDVDKYINKKYINRKAFKFLESLVKQFDKDNTGKPTSLIKTI